ncbi:MAG: SLC13 family permease [Zestosphaera sp.]
MKLFFRVFILFAVSLSISYVLMSFIKLPSDGVGGEIVRFWCSVRVGESSETCWESINSTRGVYEQVVSLSLFLTVIGLTVISMRLRYFAAFFSAALMTFMAVVPPQELIAGIEWRLILFLIGSMVFAYILRRLKVFEYIAVRLLYLSKGSPYLLALYLSLFAWFLALAVDEVTSIVYVMMLVMDVRKITKYDVRPLVILSVLATNTGSIALPVGNPIGIYLSFEAQLTVNEFIYKALPLSLLSLIVMLTSFALLTRKYLTQLSLRLVKSNVESMVTQFYANITRREFALITHGIMMLVGFLTTIALNSPISFLISQLGGFYVDPHSLLSFTPYVFIVLSAVRVSPEELEEFIVKGVEWPSILFFITLFMLGHSLLWSGAASKLAYLSVLTSLSGGIVNYTLLNLIILTMTAILSSVLDNLSVIVAMTPVAKVIASLSASNSVFWTLLYGGTLGGNYTPIGSTANLVAVGMSEKSGIEIGWGGWLKLASIATTLQIIVSILWSSLLLK